MPVALLPEQLRIVELGVVKVGLDLGGVLVGALEAQDRVLGALGAAAAAAADPASLSRPCAATGPAPNAYLRPQPHGHQQRVGGQPVRGTRGLQAPVQVRLLLVLVLLIPQPLDQLLLLLGVAPPDAPHQPQVLLAPVLLQRREPGPGHRPGTGEGARPPADPALQLASPCARGCPRVRRGLRGR